MMKRNFINLSIIGVFFAICSLFISCSGEKDGYRPLFYNITKEVKLDAPVVTGNVYSIVEAGTYLFACNGNIYQKTANAERGWTSSTLPQGTSGVTGENATANVVIRLATIDGYLYAFTSNDKIYCSPVAEALAWTEIAHNRTDILTIFDNEAPYGTGARRAFASTDTGNLLELTGTTLGTTEVTDVVKAPDLTSATTYIPVKAVYLANSTKTIVSNDMLLTSNRDAIAYHMVEDCIYYTTDAGANWTGVSIDSTTPYSLAYYSDGSNGWLYVGTKTGIDGILLNSNTYIPIASYSSSHVVGNNLDSCLGDMQIIGIYPYPFQSGNVYAAAVVYYTSTAGSNTNKLWGYYPTRSNGENATWNCE